MVSQPRTRLRTSQVVPINLYDHHTFYLRQKKQVQNDDHIISGVHWWLYENNYMVFSFKEI